MLIRQSHTITILIFCQRRKTFFTFLPHCYHVKTSLNFESHFHLISTKTKIITKFPSLFSQIFFVLFSISLSVVIVVSFFRSRIACWYEITKTFLYSSPTLKFKHFIKSSKFDTEANCCILWKFNLYKNYFTQTSNFIQIQRNFFSRLQLCLYWELENSQKSGKLEHKMEKKKKGKREKNSFFSSF